MLQNQQDRAAGGDLPKLGTPENASGQFPSQRRGGRDSLRLISDTCFALKTLGPILDIHLRPIIVKFITFQVQNAKKKSTGTILAK